MASKESRRTGSRIDPNFTDASKLVAMPHSSMKATYSGTAMPAMKWSGNLMGVRSCASLDGCWPRNRSRRSGVNGHTR